MTEDWAEIRRLHKSEQMSIKAIVRHDGIGEEHGSCCVGLGCATGLPRVTLRVRGSMCSSHGSERCWHSSRRCRRR